MTPHTTRTVSILLYENVEALDFAGPFEVFTTANRMYLRDNAGKADLFGVQCVARDDQAVRVRAGIRCVPDVQFSNSGHADVLIVPGGVVDAPMACPDTLAWIARTAQHASVVASVCTGAFLLAKSGVINHGPVTTHWEDLDDLRKAFPTLDVREDIRWVTQGKITSSAGISAGIDMSLHLVAQIAGLALATRTAKQMDYRWQATP